MKALAPLLADDARMFGGGGGITVLEELRNGAAGLIPGVGFNEIFLAAWDSWQRGESGAAEAIIKKGAPLTKAVSGKGPRILAAHAQAFDEAPWQHPPCHRAPADRAIRRM